MVEIDASDIIAAFDVDAQNCFTPLCPGELPVPEGHSIVGALNAQAELAHWRVGSKDAHPESAIWVASEHCPQLTPIKGQANSDMYWNLHAVPGTRGFELLEGLPAVMDYDFFVWKGVEPDLHPYGACYHDLADTRSTGVIEFLRDRHTDTVLVGGLALDFCVKVTVLQLLNAGFRVIVNLSATRSLTEETERQAMAAMRDAGAEFINSLDELVFSSDPAKEA
ncbi:amidase [Endozoicomonas montiporae]|uniref:nicotinamidase n=2 Tax=Endozoicomonas montiporae TaxID=1027273 RepID=A0A081NC42_9GAMM|nr:nicotinamidase [Endozoicomonas montiporae]AMO56341.1 nicotinamidase/pyrazinamidase [Endozoicomonas montiporae CL-33]KEQ16015.1 amidase [Endozoicomonas montiporae]